MSGHPDTEHCSACGTSFDGGPIPEDIRHRYAPPHRWSRKIAIVDREIDHTVAWQCPDCNHMWSSL